MPKDHKRHLIHDMKGNFVEIEKETYKSKPRDIPYEIFKSMVVDRDRLFYKEAQAKGDIATMEFLINRHK